MKSQLVIALVGMALVPCIGLSVTQPDDKSAEESNLFEEWALLKEPLEKQGLENSSLKKPAGDKNEKSLVAKAQQVLQVLEAIGDAAAEMIVGAGVDPDPLEQQFAPQFAQLLNSELHFIRTICQPNPEQYKTIKKAGDAGLRVAVKKYADGQKKMQQGIRSGQLLEWPDPRKIIADKLAGSVRQTLSAEQAKRFQLELEKRATTRKRAALLNVVANLDQDLILTAEQRAQLTETLDSNWKDVWGQQLELFLYGGQFLPILPTDRVLPILNETQQEIWKGMPKNQNIVGGWLGFAFVQPGDFPDDVEEPVTVENTLEKNNNEKNNNEKNNNEKNNNEKNNNEKNKDEE